MKIEITFEGDGRRVALTGWEWPRCLNAKLKEVSLSLHRVGEMPLWRASRAMRQRGDISD